MGEKGGQNLYVFIHNNSINYFDPYGQKSYTAYREFDLPFGEKLWNPLDIAAHIAGHVYLAFKVAGEGLTPDEQDAWCKFLSKKGYTKVDHPPVRGSRQYQDWITFSFHPWNVMDNVPNNYGQIVSVLLTKGTFVDLNNFESDITPVMMGEASKNLIETTDIQQEFALFTRAEKSLAAKGQDFGKVFAEQAPAWLKLFNNYGLIKRNCGAWAKYVVSESGLSWPLNSLFYNAGIGVGGPLSIPAKILDTGFTLGYGILNNLGPINPPTPGPVNNNLPINGVGVEVFSWFSSN